MAILDELISPEKKTAAATELEDYEWSLFSARSVCGFLWWGYETSLFRVEYSSVQQPVHNKSLHTHTHIRTLLRSQSHSGNKGGEGTHGDKAITQMQ